MKDRDFFYRKLIEQQQYIASLYKDHVWAKGRRLLLSSEFMFAPLPGAMPPFLGMSHLHAKQVDSVQKVSVQELVKEIRSLDSHKQQDYKNIILALKKLINVINNEQAFLTGHLVTDEKMLKERVASIQSKEELERLGQDIYRDEFAFRLNVNPLFCAGEAITDFLHSVLPYIESDDKDSLKEMRQMYLQAESAIEMLTQVLKKYDELKACIKPFMSQRDCTELEAKREACISVLQSIHEKYGDIAAISAEKLKKRQLEFEFEEVLEKVKLETAHLARLAKTNAQYATASREAEVLYQSLKTSGENYFSNKMSAKDFNGQCNTALRTAEKTLNGYYGWRELLAAIGCVVTSIVTLGFAPVISKLTTGSFRFFNVPGAKEILKPIENEVTPVLDAVAS
ncbi:hypothetical protein [Legionella londiniensis]|uniref:Ninein n=1 Tax=Legionella londiniensis TaxID=45068 RepID=A0A0W0VJ94_9GAMM|nr:hypothetical protein [Legionella londiniensis]KTD20158.1 hypothetical protein Llon_1779 [Legionella londiniensis]STX94325.1 Uncharacterised protein [Legionella londiniensis]